MKKLFPLFYFIFITTFLFSQKIEYPPLFYNLLEKVEAEYFEPVDAGYRDYEPHKNKYLNSHFAIRSNKEKMDIRYFIIPWNDDNPNASNPNIRTFTTLTNVATNSDDAIISAIQPTKESLLKEFNADWGMTYFFQPKDIFSDREHCRMIALCKEGKGTVFIFYLFDDVNNEALDTRYLAFRFL